MFFKHRTVAQAALAALAFTVVCSAPVQAQEATASGEVRRVNAQEGKITLKHGDIPELELTAMSLVYRIDPALLAGIAPGDSVKFTARREDGQYVIVKIAK
ncbi:MAG: copper-binding protein [Castellaniella sp.]